MILSYQLDTVRPGMWCGKFNSASNVLVCETQRKVNMYGCVSEWVGSVCVCGVCVCGVWCVCVLLVHLFQDDLRCLFIPHQVNHGGVQKSPPPQVSLYKSHTTELHHWRTSQETLVGYLSPSVYIMRGSPAPCVFTTLSRFRFFITLHHFCKRDGKQISRKTKK